MKFKKVFLIIFIILLFIIPISISKYKQYTTGTLHFTVAKPVFNVNILESDNLISSYTKVIKFKVYNYDEVNISDTELNYNMQISVSPFNNINTVELYKNEISAESIIPVIYKDSKFTLENIQNIKSKYCCEDIYFLKIDLKKPVSVDSLNVKITANAEQIL